MVDAVTGNSMIPTDPGIAAAQIAAGAKVIAPPSSGAPPMVGEPPVAPAPPVEAYDFWSGVEKQIAPAQVPPEEPAAPAQLDAVPPVVPPVPAPVVPEATALTPEQQAAIVEAGAAQAQPVLTAPTAAPVTDQNLLIQQTIEHLARTEYAMPQDVADKLVSKPEEVYPTLAATMHVRLATQIGQAVQNLLPSVIDKIVTAKLEANRLENDFFRSYPQLADIRFRTVVAQSLSMARTASPQAPREQIMSDGAALAAMKLRLQPQAIPQPGQPVVPQAIVQPALIPVQPQVLAPFQPAVGGGGALPNPAAPELVNEFEALAMDQNW